MRLSRASGPHCRRRAVPVLAACFVVALAGGVALASAVTGRLSGQVVSVKGKSVLIKLSQSLVDEGYPVSSTISVGSAPIRDDVTVSSSMLKTGVCVTAMGTSASGVIDASSITISAPVKGSCSRGGFSGHDDAGSGASRSGNFPSGSFPTGRSSGSFAGFGGGNFAVGSVTAIDGTTLTVKGTTSEGKSSLSKVKVGSTTKLTLDRSVGASAISKGECVEAAGTSSNNGVALAATAITLSKPTSSGCTAPSLFGSR
jgi:hypothetical protein